MPSEQMFSDSVGFDHQYRGSHSPNTQSRPASALDHHARDDSGRWKVRPKSTPTHASRHAPSSAKISRPKTAAVILGRTECNRVHQLEYEPTRRHNLENHLPLKRAKPPPWQKHSETPLVPFVVGPGYILSRSKSKCHVTLKDEFFDPVLFEDNKKKVQGDPERDSLIAQLQQQISDLTLYLEEERLNHRQTKQRAEEFLRDKVDQMCQTQSDTVRDLETNYQDEMDRQKRQLEDEHKENQAGLEKQIGRMVKEIEFLQGAFESYKSTLHTETAGKWNAKEEELLLKNAEDKKQAIAEMTKNVTAEFTKRLTEQKKNFNRTLDTVKKEAKRDLDNLVRRFANAAADMERLKKCTAELNETKSELTELKEMYTDTCVKLTHTTRSLTDAKVRLMEFEEKFQERVAQVDDKYRAKLEELMTQNTELKRMFISKCGQLYDEKSHTEVENKQRVTNVKETLESLIKSKERANMSIALGGHDISKVTSGKSRPLSAPGTRSETHTAHGTAGEIKDLAKQREFVAPDINMTPDPELEVLRSELMAEPVREISKEELMKHLDDF